MRKILFALLAIALVVLVACSPKTAEPTAPVGDQPLAAPTPAEETTATDSVAPAPELELVSNGVCADGLISVVVTNTNDVAWTLADDVKIILNGGWDKTPGCDQETLEPGQTTACSSIDFPIVNKPGKKNVLVVTAKGARGQATIICPEAAATEETTATE